MPVRQMTGKCIPSKTVIKSTNDVFDASSELKNYFDMADCLPERFGRRMRPKIRQHSIDQTFVDDQVFQF